MSIQAKLQESEDLMRPVTRFSRWEWEGDKHKYLMAGTWGWFCKTWLCCGKIGGVQAEVLEDAETGDVIVIRHDIERRLRFLAARQDD